MNKTTVAQQANTASVLPLAQGNLQRKCACGNHTVAGGECAECAKKKSGLQRKLAIGASNDPLEREADRVADQVMAVSTHSVVSGAPLNIQRYAGQATEGSNTAPASVDRVLASSGKQLEPALRQDMEQRFGHDFSQVRIHTDAKAEESARAVNALAYTVGRDIVFGAGRLAPGTHEGRRLLAHELTHVVQHAAHGYGVGARLSRSPDEEASWEKDQSGSLYYKTQKEAERRKSSLEEAGEWSEYRVTSFERKGVTYWRVEMRGRKQTPAPPAAKQPTSGTPAAPPASPGPAGGTTSGVRRVFSLTFDDGPHSAELGKGINRTEKVLDTLKAKGVKGGFFIQTGVSFRGASAVGKTLVKRMQTEGHKVGIHTGGTADHESHPTAEAAGRLTSELTAAKNYINTETGVTPDLVRPPFGRFNTAVEAVYTALSLTNLLWDIDGDKSASNLVALKARLDSSNARDPGIPAIHARGWTGTTPSHPKIVILYHDVRGATANNIGSLIDHIKSATSTATGGKDTADFDPP